MSPINPSFCLQNRTDHPASAFRLALGAVAAGGMAVGATSPAGGVHPAFGNAMAVTGTSGLSVNVDTGLVYMPATTAWYGAYVGYNAASYNITLAAVSTTQWRTDAIVAVQNDSAVGGTVYGANGADGWDIVAITGTFSSSSPGATPTLPNSSVLLALIRVTPNMTVTNGVGTVVDSRSYMPLNGPIWTTSAGRPPTTAPEGTTWWETDTHLMGILVQGAYQYMYLVPGTANPPDTWHALPVLQNSWALITGLPSSGYRKRPSDPTVVEFMCQVQNGNRADGTSLLTMPAGYAAAGNYQRMGCSTGTGWTSPRTDGESPQLLVDTSGNVTLLGMPNGAGPLYCNSQYRCA